MSKAVEMSRVSARGGFTLFLGLVTSTVMSAIGVIVVARFLSPSEYGVVAIAFMVPNFITVFRDWGVDSAMIRWIAQYRSENELANVKSVLVAGLLFELALGCSLSLVSFLLSGFLATNLFQRPDAGPLMQVASLSIFAGALQKYSQSVFTGYEKMEFNSFVLICQSSLKTVLSSLLVILGLGAFGAIFGMTIAFLIAGSIGTLLLYLTLYKNLRHPNVKLKILETVRNMVKYGFPLSISIILTGFLTQFYNFLMAIYCVDLMIGNYQVAANFAVLITFFATPITTVLFPAFSKLIRQDEAETLRNVFQVSVKYAALLVVPATTAVIVLSQPAISTLFGERYAYAPLYLILISTIYLYSAFGSLSIGSLLNSQGKTVVNLKLNLITSAMGFPLSLLLIPKFGVIGLIVTTLISGIPGTIAGLWWIKKHFAATIDWASSAKTLLASTLASLITYTAISQLRLPNWITLIFGALIFLISYATLAPLVGAINKTDVQNLREMLKELGPGSHIFNLPLNLIEKLIFTSKKT